MLAGSTTTQSSNEHATTIQRATLSCPRLLTQPMRACSKDSQGCVLPAVAFRPLSTSASPPHAHGDAMLVPFISWRRCRVQPGTGAMAPPVARKKACCQYLSMCTVLAVCLQVQLWYSQHETAADSRSCFAIGSSGNMVWWAAINYSPGADSPTPMSPSCTRDSSAQSTMALITCRVVHHLPTGSMTCTC